MKKENKTGFYWDNSSTFEKFLFCLGWVNAFNMVFWAVFFIVYGINQKKYRDFFNPVTFLVPYIFGIVIFAFLIVVLLILLLVGTFMVRKVM
jgi:hypothetical protein